MKWFWTIVCLVLVSGALQAQSVTITSDTLGGELRLFGTYRSASGAAQSARAITWAVAPDAVDPGNAVVEQWPGTPALFMRYVRIRGTEPGSVYVTATAVVSGVTYTQTVGPIKIVQSFTARVARLDSLHQRLVNHITGAPISVWGRNITGTLEIGQKAQLCVRWFALNRVVEERCAQSPPLPGFEIASSIKAGNAWVLMVQ